MKIIFTNDSPVVAKHFPPVPASNVLPEWYKNLPRYVIDKSGLNATEMAKIGYQTPQTIRGCLPVLDYMKSGYIIKASADIIVTPKTLDGKKDWDWASPAMRCEGHPHEQCPIDIDGTKHIYFKVMNSWRVKTPAGCSCYFYQPDFFLQGKLKLFPAVVDTDTYTDSVNFPGIIIANETFLIRAGDPLMVVFPFVRTAWQHEISIAPQTDSLARRFFENGYGRLLRQKKQYR